MHDETKGNVDQATVIIESDAFNTSLINSKDDPKAGRIVVDLDKKDQKAHS